MLVFIEENHSLSQAQSQMRYAASLARRYAYASSYKAITHPSLPNYLAIAGGQTYGVANDDGPENNQVGGRSVFGQALAAGKTAALYAEGMRKNCALSQAEGGSADYAVKHNPWAYFTTERDDCRKYDVPIERLDSAITTGAMPNAGMVIPNLCNDAHDCDLHTADTWFKGWMTKIMDGPDWKSGHLLVVLTADEDDSQSKNNVLTIVIHPSQRHRVVTAPLTHYSLARLYGEVTGTAYLANAASAPSMATEFGFPLS
jgi:hypothetical protein